MQTTVTATPCKDNATIFAWAGEARIVCEEIAKRNPDEGWHVETMTNGLLRVESAKTPTVYARLAVI